MFRSWIVSWLLLVLVALAPVGLTGCASEDIVPEPVVHTPLELDPTEDIEIAEWWTTGERLLHLYEDGRYALYNSTNRYDTPVQRGRWSQGSYAVLWLEPYTTEHKRIRVRISQAGAEPRLTIPRVGELAPLRRPPRVVEDQLIGVWQGPGGDLHLHGDKTFEYKPVHGDMTTSRLPTSGQWRTTDKSVTLLPNSPAYTSARLDMKMSNHGMILDAPHGTFNRGVRERVTTETSTRPQ